MVAAGSLFLLCLTASSYPCRHGSTSDVRRHATPLWGGMASTSSSSDDSGPGREDRKQSQARVPRKEMFILLQQFQTREGHCKVPRSHKEDGANLGGWVSRQRHLKKTGQLDLYRQKHLEEIGFAWNLEVPWEEMFSLLKQFKKREGHCIVPRSHKENEEKLGRWVGTQRESKQLEKLDLYRQKHLEDVGFQWSVSSATWDEMYALLNQFMAREGHCNVPQSHTEDEYNLGTWTNTQRQLNRTGKLDIHRQESLEEVGFQWSVTSATWDAMYALFNQFMTREGHCNVPNAHKEDGANLGTWANTQRHLKKTGKLDGDRQMRLEELSPAWGGRLKKLDKLVYCRR